MATSLFPDAAPTDNEAIYSERIGVVFDPNITQVNRINLTPAEVMAEERLVYTLRFQNTSTDSTGFLRIVDTLSYNLNLASFEILASSHPFDWSLIQGNRIDFKLTNVQLTGSGTDELGSRGFFTYRVKPKSTLMPADEIIAKSTIFLGPNLPSYSSTVATKVEEVLSTNSNLAFVIVKLYPNPAQSEVTIKWLSPETTPPAELLLYDALGRLTHR